MALIRCHECGSDVSTEAAACMKCGAKPRPAVDTSSVIAVNKGNPVLVLVGVVIFCAVLITMAYVANSVAPASPTSRALPSGQKLLDEEIERQADLCKNGHMEACDTERQLALLKSADDPFR